MTLRMAVRPIEEARGRRGTPPPLAVLGPTASGKTEASLELARRLEAEILVVDSMTVYRGMDVGTAKPSAEQRAAVPHHLLDLVDPTEPFSVAAFQAAARDALGEVAARGRRPLLVGGSGLYVRAVVDELEFPGTDPSLRRLLETEGVVFGPRRLHRRLDALDPAAAAKIDPENLRRTVRALEVAGLHGRVFSSYAHGWKRYPVERVRAAGVRVPMEALGARIEERARRMFEGDLAAEVGGLLERGFAPFLTASQAIGYLEMMEHLEGRLGLPEALDRTVRRTRALARRQMAWFRRDPRIRWFEGDQRGAGALVDEIEEYLR